MGIRPRMARASAPPEVAADFSADVVVGLEPARAERVAFEIFVRRSRLGAL